jgi:hypothetical protein
MQFIVGEVIWIHIQKLCPCEVLRIIFICFIKEEKVPTNERKTNTDIED